MSAIFKHIISRKSFWGLFLACFFMLQPFAKFALLLNYAYNYDYYSTVLCENISKPEMKCHGNCKLSKQIEIIDNKSTSESNENNSKRTTVSVDSEYTINSTDYLHFAFSDIAFQKWCSNYINNFSSNFSKRIFQPPKSQSFG